MSLPIPLDDRLVEAWRHEVDQVHRARELVMLARRHLTGNEDAEVADGVVN